MIVLVKGTPDSGKSALAERLALELAGESKKYYIATMIPFGEEGQKRVEKHRKMRAGKGFETIEQPRNLKAIDASLFKEEVTVLLECVSNLVGNELFYEGNQELSDLTLTEKIMESIKDLSRKAENLIIVTNEFEKDMEGYDDITKRYVNLTDIANAELKEFADKVYEHKEGVWIEYDNH